LVEIFRSNQIKFKYELKEFIYKFQMIQKK
jgi:hypothetical protein